MFVRFMQRLFKCLRIGPNRDGLSDSLRKSAVNDVADHKRHMATWNERSGTPTPPLAEALFSLLDEAPPSGWAEVPGAVPGAGSPLPEPS